MNDPSYVLVLAKDMETGQTFPDSDLGSMLARHRYAAPIPPIAVQVKSSYPLNAGYLSNIGFDFDNKIDVTVDWSNSGAGAVEFT